MLCKLPEGQGRLSAGGVTHSLYKLCVNVAGDGVYGFGFAKKIKPLAASSLRHSSMHQPLALLG